jgi:glycosyltransferase involved in cell wall biosynthesis
MRHSVVSLADTHHPVRPVHLMQVTYSLGVGGSEGLARDLALGLQSSALRCSVCAVDMGGPLAEELSQAGISTRVMGRRTGFDWRLVLRFYGLFLRARPDIVQTHHLTQLVYAGAAARLAGARLVHVEHEYFSLMNPRSKRRLSVLAKLCHRIVAVGEEVRTFLVREVGLDPDHVETIPNGIDLTRYTLEPRVSREALGLAPEVRLIGNIARLEADKDHETLLSAFRSVHHRHPSARLVLVGDGTLRRRLCEIAAELGILGHVDFLGVRRDVSDLLPHLDVFALSSVREGLPLAVLEAMASGRAVVATAVGELPRLIEDGITGHTVPPNNPGALAAAICAVMGSASSAQRLGLAARQTVARRFDLTTTVRRYRDVYKSLLPRTIR